MIVARFRTEVDTLQAASSPLDASPGKWKQLLGFLTHACVALPENENLKTMKEAACSAQQRAQLELLFESLKKAASALVEHNKNDPLTTEQINALLSAWCPWAEVERNEAKVLESKAWAELSKLVERIIERVLKWLGTKPSGPIPSSNAGLYQKFLQAAMNMTEVMPTVAKRRGEIRVFLFVFIVWGTGKSERRGPHLYTLSSASLGVSPLDVKVYNEGNKLLLKSKLQFLAALSDFKAKLSSDNATMSKGFLKEVSQAEVKVRCFDPEIEAEETNTQFKQWKEKSSPKVISEAFNKIKQDVMTEITTAVSEADKDAKPLAGGKREGGSWKSSLSADATFAATTQVAKQRLTTMPFISEVKKHFDKLQEACTLYLAGGEDDFSLRFE
eukprot:6110627-Amphidinium_carterae.2